MKISICIPHYNRIEFLIESLRRIERQDYQDLEVIVSDDCSTDTSLEVLKELKLNYKYPLTYFRFDRNRGYDRNLRKSMELATGDYCFILGNDDTLNHLDDITFLVDFLQKNHYPEIGFCNSVDYFNKDLVLKRAFKTDVIGYGEQVALKYYSSFSFVAGLIFKRSAFIDVNTNKLDKSIYVQIYLAVTIIVKGGNLFTLNREMVLKDIRVQGAISNSYRDTLPRSWKEYERLDAGLPSYVYVTITALKNTISYKPIYTYKILKRIFLFTYPYWIIDYRKNRAWVAAWGLKSGLLPNRFKEFSELKWVLRVKLFLMYILSTCAAFMLPVFLFDGLKITLYKLAKSI